MADKKSEKSPFLKETTALKPERDEDLLGRAPGMRRSPLVWFILLAIPVLGGLYAGFSRPSVVAGEAPKAVSYTPEGVVIAAAPPQLDQPGYMAGRSLPVSCDFKEWVGRQADEAMQASLKAQKRAFRILPPGSAMTMDYSEDRVNFNVDPDGKITRVWCG